MPFGSPVPEALQALLGRSDRPPTETGAAPSWQGRVKEAAYVSPTGTRQVFTFENVARETTKRTAAFEFPGVNDAYVQDNGYGARRYPLRCIFWGNDHDILATHFEGLLLEPGVGKLEHPLYGTFDVVPFGDIIRRDDLATAANETVVDVTFWTTTGAVYPSAEISPKNEILARLTGLDLALSAGFASVVQLKSPAAVETFKAQVLRQMTLVSQKLAAVAAVNAAVLQDFRDIETAVNFGIDILVGQPLQLAEQLSNMIKAPARALAAIRGRLDGYRALLDAILQNYQSSGALDASPLPRARVSALNSFATDDLVVMNAVAGSVLSVVNHTFTTKPEALAAAELVLAQLEDAVAWREARFGGLSIVDDGAAYQALQEIVALVAGYLVQISFQVVPERALVLDRQRTIIDVAAEVYGSVDDRLDFLISSNNLSGEEILELQRGRVVRYYV